MVKTILLTGATDGIGFETAKLLATDNHILLLHGRSDEKLARVKERIWQINQTSMIETYCADFSKLTEVTTLAEAIKRKHTKLDVLINNAGIFKLANPKTSDGYDIRFIVNTVAPYLLTKRLLPLMSNVGRVINLSSAAQSPIDYEAFFRQRTVSDSEAYAQSKLGITMWTNYMARLQMGDLPSFFSVNPASFLGSKMVKEAYGTAGNDLSIGAKILVRAALSDEFGDANGRYFDNDLQQFSQPHGDALNVEKTQSLVNAIEDIFLS